MANLRTSKYCSKKFGNLFGKIVFIQNLKSFHDLMVLCRFKNDLCNSGKKIAYLKINKNKYNFSFFAWAECGKEIIHYGRTYTSS